MTACGFDFGTSNSAIGVVRNGAPELAPVEGESALLPSALFFDSDSERHLLFGTPAIDAYIHGDDGRLMRAFKSILASPLIDQPTAFGRRRILLRDVVGFFVREMKHRAEHYAGAKLVSVVHGRPVHFGAGDAEGDARAQRVLEEVARGAGFQNVEFEFEPIAAALHYEASAEREELILVADIGGGTSDFSVVRIGPARRNHPDRRSDILANAGVRIGGTDFDSALSLQAAMPLLGFGSHTAAKNLEMPKAIYHELSSWPLINFLYTYNNERAVRELFADAREPMKLARLLKTLRKRLGHRIALAVEAAKLLLSTSDAATIDLAFLETGLAAPATRSAFEAAIAARTARLTGLAAACVKDAGVAPGNIETVFFTGGSSLVPSARAAVAKAVPSARLESRSDFLSVAYGLTRAAALRFG